MEIKPFTVTELRAALASETFWRADPLPITRHKALSCIHNPRAEENDLLLLVAYRGVRVVGYLGILPDRIFTGSESIKIGWLTGWWVDPRHASAGVGTALLFKALNAYEQRIGVSGNSKAAGRALLATRKFVPFRTLKGLTVSFRTNASGAVPEKRAGGGKLQELSTAADVGTDEIVQVQRIARQQQDAAGRRLSYEYAAFIDEETDAFIRRHNQLDLTRKGAEELNWFVRYPWVLSAPTKGSAAGRYFFSSSAGRFCYHYVKVSEEGGGLIGFCMLKVRDDRATDVYSFFDDRHALAVATAVAHQALSLDLAALSIYDERLAEHLPKLGDPHRSAKKVSRGFLISRPLAEPGLADRRLQAGDGDLALY